MSHLSFSRYDTFQILNSSFGMHRCHNFLIQLASPVNAASDRGKRRGNTKLEYLQNKNKKYFHKCFILSKCMKIVDRSFVIKPST